MSSIIRTMARGNARWTRNDGSRGLDHLYAAGQRNKQSVADAKIKAKKQKTARNREQRKQYGSLMFLNQRSNRNA